MPGRSGSGVPRPARATLAATCHRGRGAQLREAVEAGLLACSRRITLEAAGTAAFPRLDLTRAALDDEGRRYLSILTAIGGTTEAYDITGALGVPTVTCHRDGTPAGCASGRSRAEAIAGALLESILGYQERGAQVSGAPMLPGTADPPFGVSRMAAALAAHGHQAVVVPLDHDPEVTAVLPYIAQVVLADD